ncbi:universal stress protein [Actinomadura vinacea]
MSEIVVGADGSECGPAAVGWAAAEAVRRSASLRVVHVVVPWLFDVPSNPRIAAIGGWMYDGGEEIVERALGRARTAAPEVEVSGGQAGGEPADVLIRESGRAVMVVVGSHGAGGPAGLLPGSVGHAMLHRARCPVAVVPHRRRVLSREAG